MFDPTGNYPPDTQVLFTCHLTDPTELRLAMMDVTRYSAHRLIIGCLYVYHRNTPCTFAELSGLCHCLFDSDVGLILNDLAEAGYVTLSAGLPA